MNGPRERGAALPDRHVFHQSWTPFLATLGYTPHASLTPFYEGSWFVIPDDVATRLNNLIFLIRTRLRLSEESFTGVRGIVGRLLSTRAGTLLGHTLIGRGLALSESELNALWGELALIAEKLDA